MRKEFKLVTAVCFIAALAAGPIAALAQKSVVTLVLEQDQIALIKVAREISTRLSFPDEVSEVICGDLYDSATGVGSFVVQRSGKDVFLKSVVNRGVSNMFVKTGAGGDKVYNFDLEIVASAQAHRVVNVNDPVASVLSVRTSANLPVPAQVGAEFAGLVFAGIPRLPADTGIRQMPLSLPPPPPVETDSRATRPRTTQPVVHGKVIRRVEPSYPHAARNVQVEGDVMIEVSIDGEGSVESARIISGHPLLCEDALIAARKWRFHPTRVGGVPVKAVRLIKFTFKL